MTHACHSLHAYSSLHDIKIQVALSPCMTAAPLAMPGYLQWWDPQVGEGTLLATSWHEHSELSSLEAASNALLAEHDSVCVCIAAQLQ